MRTPLICDGAAKRRARVQPKPSQRNALRALAFAFAGTLLFSSGCMHLARFSNSATDFNAQVADAQNRILLLNIVRAANRYPMHFTELTTLSGTNTATLGGTITVPAWVLDGGMGTGSVAPTATVSQTPTFNVAVLETQEFYRGMLSAVSLDQWSTYLDEGLPPEEVFTLAFLGVLYQESPSFKATPFENDFHPLSPDAKARCPQVEQSIPNNPNPKPVLSEYLCFREIIRALVARHLTIEQVPSATNFGPLLTQSAFNDLKWLSGLDPKTFKIAAVDQEACLKKDESCPEGKAGVPPEQWRLLEAKLQLYRVQNEKKDYRLCFDEPLHEEFTGGQPRSLTITDRIAYAYIPPKLICHSRLAPDYKPKKEDPKFNPAGGLELRDGNTGDPFLVRLQRRSTEGIVYFLGQIARCTTLLDTQPACDEKPKILVSYYRKSGLEQDILFDMKRGATRRFSRGEANQETIEVNWGADGYSVHMDPSAQDRSGQVLRIVAQLLALNRSAKDFPTPAVVPVISH